MQRVLIRSQWQMDGRSRGIFLLLLLLVAKVLVGGCDLRGNTKAAAAVEINARQKRRSGT